MKILIASNNLHKIDEVKKIINSLNANIQIATPKDLNIDIEVNESGTSLEENSFLKAKAFFEAAKIPVIADDTGLEVEALQGMPGVYSARYAGENCDASENRKKLIKELESVNMDNRSAQFRTVICCYDGIKPIYFEGICKGKIIDKEIGSNGFGYDSIFVPENFNKTFAQLSDEEKNAISHRGMAIRSFAKNINSLNNKVRIGFLASGGGSNMLAILRNIENHNINAIGAILITNNSDCGAANIAKNYGMPIKHISSAQFDSDILRDKAIADELLNAKVDLVILAGYMKKVNKPIIEAFPNKILNIHPALLPKFGGQGMYGMNVHKAVIEAGETVSGCTVHIVNNEYDRGKILLQKSVPVQENDTPEALQKRVLEQEHILYSETIRKILNGEFILK